MMAQEYTFSAREPLVRMDVDNRKESTFSEHEPLVRMDVDNRSYRSRIFFFINAPFVLLKYLTSHIVDYSYSDVYWATPQ